MPTYVLTNTKTNKSFDKFCSYSDLEKYLEDLELFTNLDFL